MKHLKAMILIMTLLTAKAFAETAQATTAPSKPQKTFSEYYTVDERPSGGAAAAKSYTYTDFSPDLGTHQFVQLAKKLVINLLKWSLHEEQRPLPGEDYIRKLHFGRWINDPTDDTCMNTRAKVLVRDSEDEVTYRNDKKCVVEAGRWYDNYTNQELTSSRQIQIDHLVPLKNAYLSGAFKWDYKTRCLYANYMGYKDHLISAESHQNMSKGDRGPEGYLPPELSYRCQYVKNWLTVKLIWRLNMTPDEVQAIHEVVTNYNCKISDFRITEKELDEQRQYINDNLEFCMINKR
ncbi:GmrSD restriction endonuclease domain-containing protein [Bdellovibrio sp. BCCA]|uniref:GmrSD restriction endonuclease domain-containing protein n=1 Tax=Bdellovibrio sp. BCCA TaxID=3136281 RepID=UPI0030F23908